MPGVSTRSRRSSGCDGLASSSSWNAVRIPNRVRASHGHDAGHAAEEDVRHQLERLGVDRPGDHRDDRQQHRRGPCVKEDRDKHADRRRRQQERQGGPAGRQLERDRRGDEEEPDEDEDVVAVPQVAPEPPDPGEQQAHEHGREDEPATELGEGGMILGEPELAEDLEVGRGDEVALPDDRLALPDRNAHRLDFRRHSLPLRGGCREAEGRVRHDER